MRLTLYASLASVVARQDLVDALRQCNQEVPLKLKALAEECWKFA